MVTTRPTASDDSRARQRGRLNMPLYMYQAAYTAESLAAQLKKPENRVEAVGRSACEAVGGQRAGNCRGRCCQILQDDRADGRGRGGSGYEEGGRGRQGLQARPIEQVERDVSPRLNTATKGGCGPGHSPVLRVRGSSYEASPSKTTCALERFADSRRTLCRVRRCRDRSSHLVCSAAGNSYAPDCVFYGGWLFYR